MDPSFFAASLVILLFSIIVHEVMHGLAALYFGDSTAQRAGRLTLNPIPHIDPIGSILLPLLLTISGSGFIIGWAKPVPVNPLNFRDIKLGEIVVSLAGVLSNFTIAVLAAILFHLLGSTDDLLSNILLYAVNINLLLGIFNLLPIPPLDGSKIVMSLLPLNFAMQFRQLERYGLLIIFLLWFIPFGRTNLLSFILGFFFNIFRSLLGI